MTARLGVVDWGIGGLGVVRELHAQCARAGRPPPSLLYLSDTGAPPYGTLSRRELEARLRLVVRFLRERGAEHVVFACNAASTVTGIEHTSGVVVPTLARMRALRAKQVVVIGGRRTIRARVYATALRDRFRVVSRVAQPLSGMIERGEHRGPAFEAAAREILRGTSDADALLLACTHYPAALPVFERLFAGRVIDPLPAVARSLARALPADRRGGEADRFFTTGDPRAMKRAALAAWGDAFAGLSPRRVRLAAGPLARSAPPS